MDAKNFVMLCNDMFFYGAAAHSVLKKMILSGADVFSFFKFNLVTLNESHKAIDEAELLKALKELEPEMRERMEKATEENIKEFNEKLN